MPPKRLPVESSALVNKKRNGVSDNEDSEDDDEIDEIDEEMVDFIVPDDEEEDEEEDDDGDEEEKEDEAKPSEAMTNSNGNALDEGLSASNILPCGSRRVRNAPRRFFEEQLQTKEVQKLYLEDVGDQYFAAMEDEDVDDEEEEEDDDEEEEEEEEEEETEKTEKTTKSRKVKDVSPVPTTKEDAKKG